MVSGAENSFITSWLDAQEKTIKEFSAQVSDPIQLKTLWTEWKAFANENIKKTSRIADAAFENQKTKFCSQILWTFPFDDSMTLRNAPDFGFINASDLCVGGQKVIASQAPLPTTVEDFWKMIILTRSTTIVSLNMPEADIDDPEPRAIEYWRNDWKDRTKTFEKWQNFKDDPIKSGEVIFSDGNWSVIFLEREVIDSEKDTDLAIVRRTFRLTNSQTQENRIIEQHHFQNWPNFVGAPCDRLFSRLLDDVMKRHQDKEIPITVHCAAGRGRAGAFIITYDLISSVMQQLVSGKKPEEVKINFAKTFFYMRSQRKDMITKSGVPCVARTLENFIKNFWKTKEQSDQNTKYSDMISTTSTASTTEGVCQPGISSSDVADLKPVDNEKRQTE